MLKTLLVVSVLLPMLVGCATEPGRPAVQGTASAGNPEARPMPNAQASPVTPETQVIHPSFVLLGRLAVQTDKRGLSGSLHWQHEALRDHISLFSPLGSKVAEILSQPGFAKLDTGEKSYTAESPEALTQQVLGWPLPVRHLTEWVRGVPDNGIAQLGQDTQGRSLGFDADGWQVRYLEYRLFSGQSLPSKLTMRSPDLYLKLVIDDWQLPVASFQEPGFQDPNFPAPAEVNLPPQPAQPSMQSK